MDAADSDEARPAPVRDGCTRVRGRRRLLQRAARIARYEQAGHETHSDEQRTDKAATAPKAPS